MTTELTLTNIQDALGIKIPGDFIVQELKITPARTEKRAMFFAPAQLAVVCDALIQHVHGVKTGTKTMVAKPKKEPKAPSLDDLF